MVCPLHKEQFNVMSQTWVLPCYDTSMKGSILFGSLQKKNNKKTKTKRKDARITPPIMNDSDGKLRFVAQLAQLFVCMQQLWIVLSTSWNNFDE